jgi:putative flippase GtrA
MMPPSMNAHNKIKIFLGERGARYIVVGGLNTLFGYLCGAFLFILLEKKIGIIYILIISNILSITFSFLAYKLFVFKTSGSWLKEYIRCYLVYGGVSAISIFLTWIFLDIFFVNIWIAQGMSMMIVIFFSYHGHKKYTFRVNHE